jgi:hypothetical protein
VEENARIAASAGRRRGEFRPALTFLKLDKGGVSCLSPASVQISCMAEDK